MEAQKWENPNERAPDRSRQLARRTAQQHRAQRRQQYYAFNLIENFKPLDDLSETKKAKDKEKMSSSNVTSGQAGQQIGDRQVSNHNNNNDGTQKQLSSVSQNGLVLGQPRGNQIDAYDEAAKVEASKFEIRTSNRRHLDFDDEYDLGNVNATQRTKWTGPFHFIQAADSQLGMIDSYVHKRIEPGWREEIELCENLVNVCNQMEPKPLFVIICGDLVDSFPGSEIGQKQVVDFKRIFSKLDPKIPLVCVCGNHDIGNEPTLNTVAEYQKTFGDDYYYFTKNDVLFIIINSQFYQHREYVQESARNQDEWLESLLEKCKLFKYSIVFEHIPWFLNDAEEDDDYFNIRKDVRLQWLRKFKNAGVTKIMCGHYHRNAGGWFEGMELVVTSAIGAQCGNDKSGVRIVRVLDNSIEHQYYAMPDIPLKIEL